MKKPLEIDIGYLKNNLYYKDGALYWKRFMGGKAKENSRAGSFHRTGYVHIQLKNKVYKEHRLVFAFFNNYCPEFLDHIDGNRSNNKIENLRPATRGQNNRNSKIPITNTSSIKGVGYWRGKWRARVDFERKHFFVGYFKTKEDAEVAVKEAREKLHKDFCRHA